MKILIYNVINEDRHHDTTATPFLDLEAAKEYARTEAKKSAGKYPEDYQERICPPGWEFYAVYSCTDDCFWITKHEIDMGKI